MGAIFFLILLLSWICFVYPVAAIVYYKLYRRSKRSIKAILADL